MRGITTGLLFLSLAMTSEATAQAGAPAAGTPAAYQPKFAGDKAHSEAEAAALGYMRTVVASQRVYRQKHGHYAESLTALVGSHSFTRRMANPNRGDYRVGFRARPQGYSLTLTPIQFDPAHRAFYVDESGEFRVADSSAATGNSEPLK
jgi:hypothetical protein